MTSWTEYSTQTPNKSTLFSGQYLRNHWTLDIDVWGYIGIVWPKEHSPEVRSFPPGTLCIWDLLFRHIIVLNTEIIIKSCPYRIITPRYNALHRQRDGIAQSVQRLATGWKVWASNPGGGRDFPHLSRPALRPTQPPIQWVLGPSRG
jgi:hypothetical protein